MNRYMLCLAGLLLGASCDRMKSPEAANAPATDRSAAANEARAERDQVEPDNTKKNMRDREDGVTPMDQGNSGTETTITASVRKAVMAEPSLSATAKNVKVITIGNHVTLRGPVMSPEEKALIATLAMQTSGVEGIDNQLEVKP